MIDAYHPWNDAGQRHQDWIIRRTSLDGLLEVMCTERKVILLEKDRTKWERRCDLAHAIAHIDLGHVTCDDRAESAAVRYAAKKLISLRQVTDAVVSTHGSLTVETAEILGVDMETLFARMTCLHPGEQGFISRAIAERYPDEPQTA